MTEEVSAPQIPSPTASPRRIVNNVPTSIVHVEPDRPEHFNRVSIGAELKASSSEDGPPASLQKTTPSSTTLQPIETRANTGTYTCTYYGCTERFDSPINLQKHKRDLHGNTASADDLAPRSPQTAPYKCFRIHPFTGKTCNMKFSRAADLRRHENAVHEIREQQTGSISPPKANAEDFAEDTLQTHQTTRKCANCGQIGHIKTNRKLCPMLNGQVDDFVEPANTRGQERLTSNPLRVWRGMHSQAAQQAAKQKAAQMQAAQQRERERQAQHAQYVQAENSQGPINNIQHESSDEVRAHRLNDNDQQNSPAGTTASHTSRSGSPEYGDVDDVWKYYNDLLDEVLPGKTLPPADSPEASFEPSTALYYSSSIPLSRRILSPASSHQFAETTRPRLTPVGPSRPYAMYPQGTTERTANVATSSTSRPARPSWLPPPASIPSVPQSVFSKDSQPSATLNQTSSASYLRASSSQARASVYPPSPTPSHILPDMTERKSNSPSPHESPIFQQHQSFGDASSPRNPFETLNPSSAMYPHGYYDHPDVFPYRRQRRMPDDLQRVILSERHQQGQNNELNGADHEQYTPSALPERTGPISPKDAILDYQEMELPPVPYTFNSGRWKVVEPGTFQTERDVGLFGSGASITQPSAGNNGNFLPAVLLQQYPSTLR